MEPKTGKLIVSKGEYVQAQLKRFGLLLGAGCLFFAFPFGIQGYWNDALRHTSPVRNHHASAFHHIMIALSSLLAIPLTGILFGAIIVGMIKRSVKISHVTPLTRANAADLPAPDSLVRASSEPVQAQQTVLLRAAEAGEERHEEQLVRASVGGD